MPPAGGKRYLTSTAVFVSEVVKLAVALTMALYDVSKTAPPSMPATSLFFSLTSAVFSGDSWKLAIPAGLGVLSNSLQYIALSNLRPAVFMVTYQLQYVPIALFGSVVFQRHMTGRKLGLIVLLLAGFALVQLSNTNVEQMSLQDERSSLHFPRSLEEWKAVKGATGNLHKRSATYEGIEEDLLTADPRLNPFVGLLATIGAVWASSIGEGYFEKVLKDSSNHTSMWVRNVQLAIYAVFPALFIGVGFRDGERIANDGFFQGYNWVVWSTILVQALGGILSTFSIGHGQRDPRSLATTANIALSIVGSVWLFDFELSPTFVLGSAAILVATHYYGNPRFGPAVAKVGGVRPPPIRVDAYEKDSGNGNGSPVNGSTNDFSIKLPSTPFLSDGMSSSRPTSPNPGHTRSSRVGLIDQGLIDGSHQSQHFATVSEGPLPPQDLISTFRDEESQLDAFDLELLAQDDQSDVFQVQQSMNPRLTPQQESFVTSYDDHNASPQRSRFFDPSLEFSYVHELGSSQSELTSGPPSSPLMRLNQRKGTSWLPRPWLEPQNCSSQYEATPSSRLPVTLSQLNTALPNDVPSQNASPFDNIPLSVRGIVLVSVQELPERYRSLYPFPLFNAIQSKCFQPVYHTNDNIVLSAPTGSGKTVVMELAICRLLDVLKDERFKVIYQAPTKSLCSERFRDWNAKFAKLDLKCAELTGDTDHMQLRNIQNSQIIITTPEKWDSMTRKWKDHMRLMQLVKLFLIDEVHILKETRGATLEAVVSRMKNIGSNVRFIALSATVPNSEDIATWLGKDSTNKHVPAHREHFGEDFRPVKLQKFVYGYHQSIMNDFAFDKICGSKLPDIIGKHSGQKPIMIFCCTRNSSVSTAKDLARLWNMTNPPARCWKGPGKRIEVYNDDLRAMISAGVAFHHAGLSATDRHVVEKGFLEGQINVICCTSTLAVGVNLPCQLVIIKNTVGWQEGGCKEYSDLEMMQMLGRAGRPQFDESATAVILTRKERVGHYERLVAGSESLESCLHLNLIDHLNAEIGLGNVTDVESAIKWLAGTFLFVRLRRNPTCYKLKEGASQEDEDALLRQICEKDIRLLQDCGLVATGQLSSTKFGDAMARYYIRFETMKALLALKPQANISEIFDAVVQAEEFREIRLKPGEKMLYREINRDPGIRYAIKVDIALPSHKVSLLLQAELGAIDFPNTDQLQKHKFSFQQDKNLVFAHVNRLIRCIIDCQIAKEDSVSTCNALELARGFGAKVWDHSPLQMKQIDQVGVVAVRKLAAAGITNMEELEAAEAPQIDMILSKNPPFGTKLLARLRDFPKLRVAAEMIGKSGDVKIRFKFEVAFMNEKVPIVFQRRPVHVCCLSETSDGRLIDFRRISARQLLNGFEATIVADIKEPSQFIICHTMCDDIAGTARKAEIKLNLTGHPFPPNKPRRSGTRFEKTTVKSKIDTRQPDVWDLPISPIKGLSEADNFDGDDLQLDDFLNVIKRCQNPKPASPPKVSRESLKDDLDWLSLDDTPSPCRQPSVKRSNRRSKLVSETGLQDDGIHEPLQLPNGNWACNHKCKDKTSCKHFCCRDGLEKPPKTSKQKSALTSKPSNLSQLTLSATITKRDTKAYPEKGKQTTKQKFIDEKKSSNISETTPFKTSNKRRSSDQHHAHAIDNNKGFFSLSDKKEENVSRGMSPSDYHDDDSLDDFPPLSTLLKDRTSASGRSTSMLSSTVLLPSEKPDRTFHRSLSDASSEFFKTEKGLTSPKTPKYIEISDDSTPNPDIFTNPGDLESSAITESHSISSRQPVAFPARRPSNPYWFDERTLNSIKKSPFRISLLPELNTMHALPRLEPMSAPVSNVEDLKAQASSDTSSGWDDIDRLLLEEFNDAINHY
ncbi:Nucleotide-sugar transporter [Penicillium macrosclerotiorum]|uniref:Nucleotide-sugar transporter n=1 Tax=Penicillium macrosclerotiorum TaxID=303699 RepID=UPI0025492D67|nr:Nucleotide-sugar transporter [Penicillium macrosclerotiorum]KAJ5679817.1 Nucleotide-sugar transporter [Penicillium macrosclerotiorum]